jgi:thymidylate synthase (FAD)
MEKLLMKVKLISHTTACVEEFPSHDMTQLVAFCARVSNPSNQMNTETADKLIEYLIKWKHWSPFEMVNVCLEIETTRDIARQILRHRSFTFQEFSQRYADPVKELEFITREARLQDIKNRQNSIPSNDVGVDILWAWEQQKVIDVVKSAYQWAIENGVAKEVARAVLPEGLTMSRMYVNGTLRSWIHYIEIRSEKATQKEHREIAIACATAIAEIFPMINNFSHNETPNAE